MEFLNSMFLSPMINSFIVETAFKIFFSIKVLSIVRTGSLVNAESTASVMLPSSSFIFQRIQLYSIQLPDLSLFTNSS